MPEFLRRLARPEIGTVLLAGCGGGFDFVHGLLLYPTLIGMGKRVVIGSYSFGDPEGIGGPAREVFRKGEAIVKVVSAQAAPPAGYCPEVHLCAFLDERFPPAAPHEIYAYYSRAFPVPVLCEFYQQLVEKHRVDAVVIMDGGSDSLMRGDEEGLGDPVEDCVSVTAVSLLAKLKEKLLVVAGLGCDRYNDVSDAATLRAVAELTAEGGFLGAIMLHAGCEAFDFYRAGVDFIDARQEFRSVISRSILAAGEGQFGLHATHAPGARKVPGSVFLWPLMAGLWGFDVEKVAARSLMSDWIRDEATVAGCYDAVHRGRRESVQLRPVENLPPHEEMRGPWNMWRAEAPPGG